MNRLCTFEDTTMSPQKRYIGRHTIQWPIVNEHKDGDENFWSSSIEGLATKLRYLYSLSAFVITLSSRINVDTKK